jgi:hypothetical protein
LGDERGRKIYGGKEDETKRSEKVYGERLGGG